jgi:hypothetical protein
MDPEFEIGLDRESDHVLVWSRSIDGTEESQRIFPKNQMREALRYFHAMQDAKCLRGFTKAYVQEAKQRAAERAATKWFFDGVDQGYHDRLWTPDGIPRSMLVRKGDQADDNT